MLVVKNQPANAGDLREADLICGSGKCPEKGMAAHSSILAWWVPWTEELGGLQSIGSQRVLHNWRDLACMHIFCRGYHQTYGMVRTRRGMWQSVMQALSTPIPVFLSPGLYLSFLGSSSVQYFPTLFNFLKFIWLHQILVVACNVFVAMCRIFSCVTEDPVSWTEIKPGTPASGAQS